MAFGFLKKNNCADTIFYNGHIITQDPEFPEAEAVACKNGYIQAVGDNAYMDEFKGSDTEMVDLEGKYLYPGFINTKIPFVFQAFRDLCLAVDVDDDLDYVISQLQDYVEENPDADTYFVFGFNGEIVEGIDEEELAVRLDQISEDKPILLLDDLGSTFRTNTMANQILVETAEEECVEILTLSYVIELFLPFDYEQSQMLTMGIMNEAADMGFTSVLTLGTPSFMNSAFLGSLLEIHTEEDLKQRYFFSQLQQVMIGNGTTGYSLVNKQTACVELGDEVSYNFLNVRLNPLGQWSKEGLVEMCKDSIERNFGIYMDCPDQDAAYLAYDVLDQLREDGLAKALLVVGLPEDVDLSFSSQFVHFDSIIQTSFLELENSSFVRAKSTQEALDDLTIGGAEILGMSDLLGSIEPDKYADFTVFNENILDFSLGKFNQPHCEMTVVAGQIVYDAQDAADMEMYDMLSTQQF